MSKAWIIVLSIIGGLILLAIMAIGGVVYWVSQNKDRLIQSIEQPAKEAKEFGAKTNNAGCLNEALARHKRDKSITGQVSTNIFLGVCLKESQSSPGFCDNVPTKGEILKSANWAVKKCSDAGLQNDQGCQQIFNAVQEYCRRSAQQPENGR